MPRGVDDQDGETTDGHIRLWMDPPDRWRIQSDGRIDLRDGETRWNGWESVVTEVDHDRSALDDTEVGTLVRPGVHLFGVCRFGTPTDDVVAGRRGWKVEASTEPDRHASRPVPFGLRLVGIDHTFWFDRDTGIVLRHLGLIDGQPCSLTEFKEVTINPARGAWGGPDRCRPERLRRRPRRTLGRRRPPTALSGGAGGHPASQAPTGGRSPR
jgi:hypothetical protein